MCNRTILPLLAFLLSARLVTAAQNHWVGTWGASPSPQFTDPAQMEKLKLDFNNQTLREIVHVSIGGLLVRVRLSNAYGTSAVQIGAAHIALRQSHSAIVPGSDRTLTFSGKSTIEVPPNALVLSDPVNLNVPATSDLAVSIFLPMAARGAGIHYAAEQTNYLSPGDQTSASELANAVTIPSWAFLMGVDVAAPPAASTLVTFGDSITDGARSTTDTNHRWPNFLSDRLQARTGSPSIGVIDEGIGGNRILHDPNANIAFGVNALARFDRDVLAQPGVKYVIVLEGINDLGHAGPDLFPNEQVSAEDIIGGLKQLIERAHEKGLKIYGGTLTPFAGVPFAGYFSNDKEVKRKAVNSWVRSSHAFDAVIDFDKALEDPDHADHMAAKYDSGDHLHPNDEGYKAMAAAINLSLFQ